jgi:hypothetical protein
MSRPHTDAPFLLARKGRQGSTSAIVSTRTSASRTGLGNDRLRLNSFGKLYNRGFLGTGAGSAAGAVSPRF